jgi:Protein of unknown function (DUF2934)
MSPDERPLYGELVIPFNTENKTDTHAEAITRADQLRAMIRDAAYFLAEKRGFVSGQELEDWLKAEMEILRNLK